MNTEQQAIYNQMVAKATTLSADELKDKILKDNAEPVLPEVVFNSLLDALEKMVTEEEFQDFLNTL